MPPLDAFQCLRNLLAHSPPELPREERFEELAQHYGPVLDGILESLAFLKDISVSRVVNIADDYVDTLILRGPIEPFPVGRLDKAHLEPTASGIGDCLLVGQGLPPRVLLLEPMAVGPLMDSDIHEVGEPILLYDGLSGRRVYYAGVSRRYEDVRNYAAVVGALFVSSPDPCGPWTTDLAQRIMEQSTAAVSANIGTKYDPLVYTDRSHYSTLIDEFATGMPRVGGLLLVGESGMGKTALLCNVVSKYLRDTRGGPLPLLLQGKDMVAPSGTDSPVGRADLGPIGRTISRTLGLVELTNWDSLLTHLGKLLGRSPEDPAPRLVIMVDAINECSHAVAALAEIDYLAERCRRLEWIRVIATVRQGRLDSLLEQLQKCGTPWPSDGRAFVRLPDEEGKLSPQVPVRRFSEREQREIYTRFQSKAVGNHTVPACLTSYDDLPERARSMLSSPLMIRLLMQGFNGQQVLPTITSMGVFQKYHEEQLTSAQQRTALIMAAQCLQARTTRIARIPDTTSGRDLDPILVYDPLDSLLDAGVCVYTADGDYAFAHQLYFEYLLYLLLVRQQPSDEDVTCAIHEVALTASNHLEEEIAAYRMLVYTLVQSGRVAPLLSAVDLLSEPDGVRFLMPLMYDLYHGGSPACELFLREVLKCRSAEVLGAAARLYDSIGEREPQLSVTRRLIEMEPDSAVRARIEAGSVRALIWSNRIDEARQLLDKVLQHASARDDAVL
ncbi:MAG: hypothetical protein M3315_12615, partial [Actinomycetota bacterium]|nr:hypothetical protein [Actinomycetota bacterium]